MDTRTTTSIETPVTNATPSAAVLQRQCACGSSASALSDHCEECGGSPFTGVQTKLKVGANDDPLEHEADRIAERVLRMPEPRSERNPDQREDSHGPGEPGPSEHRLEAYAIRRRPLADGAQAPPGPRHAPEAADADASPVPEPTGGESPAPKRATLPSRASELTTGGAPLGPELLRYFEPRFGRDLSAVRLHTGPRAEAWSEGLGARAFTLGNHIWLGRGQRPAASFLMAHELAHVVQQRQPKRIHPRPQLDRDDRRPGRPVSDATIRRAGLPFWVPLGPKGMLTGSAIHKDLLSAAVSNNNELDTEAPAPNARHDANGVGNEGSIDLYRGERPGHLHARVGLTFDGKPGSTHPSVQTTQIKKHFRANKAGIKAGNFNPHLADDNSIAGIDKGPTHIKLGELKPASKTILDQGAQQLGHYEKGFELASRYTNEWASLNSVSERWTIDSIQPLEGKEVNFNVAGVSRDFNPASPKADTKLVLADVKEKPDKAGSYKHSIVFNPEQHGLDPIMGGLYAQKYGSGNNGLWMYFARPQSLKGAQGKARKEYTKGLMEVANKVQDEVIDPLLEAPSKDDGVARKKALPSSDPQHATPPSDLLPSPAVIRRAPKKKPPKLKDDFDHAKWKTSHESLREKIHDPTATKDTRKQLAAVRLLDKAYDAEAALDQVPGTGKSTLPEKSKDLVDVISKDPRKVHKRELAGMAGWIEGWTSKPAKVLGKFRNTFGGSFVWVANKLVDLRDRIRRKFKEAFEKNPSRPTGGKGRIIAKALLKALLQVAKVVIPQAVHRYMDSVVAGTKKKLATEFELDPVRFADEHFETQFEDRIKKLESFKDDAEAQVEKVVGEYTADLAWIKDVIDKSRIIGPILEAASIAIQCGSPPGWGCLKLLARPLVECGMEMAMNLCPVQKQVADVVSGVGPLADLPATLAQKALDVSKAAAPDSVKDVFSEPVAKSGLFDSDDIECEDSPIDSNCPSIGLFPMPGAGGGGDEPKPEKDGETKAEQPEPEPDTPDEPSGKPEPSGPPDPETPSKAADEPGETPGSEGKDGPSGEKDGQQATGPGESGAGKDAGESTGSANAGGGKAPYGEVHERLRDLVNEHGTEKIEAIVRLAESAGMPDDAELTAKQVEQLMQLLKSGQLTAEELQKIAGGEGGPKLKQRAAPLERFLEKEAHRSAMEQTLQKLRTKQYKYKFDEMARQQMHWKILRPYRPGPFRNAPVLMWNENIRAAGVADGNFGECYDGGRITLTVTGVDLREEGTEKKVQVHTPFHDRDARLQGGVCPTPPAGTKPPPGGTDAPPGSSGGSAQKGREQERDDPGRPPEPEAGQKQGSAESEDPVRARDEGQEEPPRADTPNEVDSDVRPGDKGDPVETPPQAPDRDATKPEPGYQEKQEPEPAEHALDVASLAEGCGLEGTCADDFLLPAYEEMPEPAHGWMAMPDRSRDPGSTLSLLKPPNAKSPFSLQWNTDGSLKVMLTCGKDSCEVARAEPSGASPDMVELISGSLLNALRASLRSFIANGHRTCNPARTERIHTHAELPVHPVVTPSRDGRDRPEESEP